MMFMLLQMDIMDTMGRVINKSFVLFWLTKYRGEIMSYKVVAVVVTFNKVELLKECVSGLLDCREMLSKIVVVNNASTDSTEKYLKDLSKKESLIDIQTENENLGGAAGFNIGLKLAMSGNPDAVWVMDNDTIPNKETLNSLLKSKDWLLENNSSWGLLASNVRWIDGSAANMNVPLAKRNWNTSKNKNLVQIEHSSFVSMFINSKAIKEMGYPISDFFIWGDDLEYSRRISMVIPSYCVTDSIVVHKMASNQKTDVFNDSADRIPRYFYDVRNNFYIQKNNGIKNALKYAVKTFIKMFKVLFKGKKYKWQRFYVIFRGFFAGMIFNPTVEKYK